MNPLQPWYGLTNQLMCYAAALRYGHEDDRAVLFPSVASLAASDVLPFEHLVDVEATQRNLAALVSIVVPTANDRALGFKARPEAPKATPQPSVRRGQLVAHGVPDALYPPVSMNKKKLFLPTRDTFRTHKSTAIAAVRAYTRKLYQSSQRFAFVRHHNFFMRFAWGPDAGRHDETFFMDAVAPCAAVRRYWTALDARLRTISSTYVAVHVRLESDAKALRVTGAKAPSRAQFKAFVEGEVARLALSVAAGAVYICTGEVSAELRSVIDEWNAQPSSKRRFVLLLRSIVSNTTAYGALLQTPPAPGQAPELPDLPRFVGSQRAMHQAIGMTRTQDHYASFVELLVLTHAARAAVTEFSSLRFAVWAKRCGRREFGARPDAAAATVRAEVLTLSIDAGGDFAPLKAYECSEGSGLGWTGHRSWHGG